MITSDDLTKAFNEAELDDPAKLAAFLKPAAVNASLADIDGQIAGLSQKRTDLLGQFQQQIDDLVTKREQKRKELQGS